MSVANNFKKNFAGLLRGLLRKVDNGDYADPQLDQRPITRQPMAGMASATQHAPAPGSLAATGGMGTIPDTFSAAVPVRSQDQIQNQNVSALASELEMPLLPILERLPADLRSKWMLGGVDLQAATISVPVKKVLPQLALGAIKITFGELRTAAPTLFRTGEEYDSLPIALPLNEVLARLNPAMIPRNPTQRVVAAPVDIAEPFGPGAGIALGAPVTPAVKPAPPTTHFYKKTIPSDPVKMMATPPAVAGQPLPFVPRQTTPVAPPQPPAAPVAPTPPIAAPQLPPQTPPLTFTPRATTPAAPLPRAMSPGAPATPLPQRATTPAMPPTPNPRVNFNPGNGGLHGSPFQNPPTRPGNGIPNPVPPTAMAKPFAPTPPPAQPPARPVPAPTPAAPAIPAQEAPSVLIPLSALCEEWPEPLRQEITAFNLGRAGVVLPIHLIEPALKRGRVAFAWQYVRSWIKPTPPPSAFDSTEVDLPLKALLPLFMPSAKKPAVQPQARAEVPPSSVPNLFFGFPQPQPEEMAPPINMPEAVPLVKPLDAKLNDSNFYVWGDGTEDPHLDETTFKKAAVPATDFTSRRAMPQDIINKAMKLPGVNGAIIALGDGLKVAQQLPAELNADTVAAFLPQLFSRVSQCAKELRMGDLNNLNFTLGNIPWKIFRVNAVYFAAFGTAGVSLPTAQLAMLAGELDRKK